MRLLPVSAMKISPHDVAATPCGEFSSANVAVLPSPENPAAVPVPAIVLIIPIEFTFKRVWIKMRSDITFQKGGKNTQVTNFHTLRTLLLSVSATSRSPLDAMASPAGEPIHTDVAGAAPSPEYP